jgi:recombination protein RecA
MAGTPIPPRDPQPRIARALQRIEARFGPDIVRRLRAAPARSPEERAISSGSVGLDLATGLEGLPRGHLTEIFGPESSGKTTLLYAALAAAQRHGGLAALIDAEGTADGVTLEGCGIDLDALLFIRPTSARDALLLLTIFARCGGLDALGLVSVPALRDLPAGTRHPASLARDTIETARLLTRGLRVLTAALRDGPTAVLVTNRSVADPLTRRSLGGLALRHFAGLRVMVTPLARLPDAAGGTGGLRVGLTVAKHKLGTPDRSAEVDILVGQGLDRAEELLRLGLAFGVIAPHPLGFVHEAEVLGHSPTAVHRRLASDATLAEVVRAAILTAYRQRTAA